MTGRDDAFEDGPDDAPRDGRPEVPEPSTPPPPSPPPSQGPVRGSRPPSRRRRIRRVLSSPQDLRDLFLLQELIGPPVGLRDRRLSGDGEP